MLSVIADGKETRYEYDGWGNLSKTVFEDGKVEYRNPDRSGNLFESLDQMDRQYARGGQLVKTKDWEYKYDPEGNLVRKKDKHGATWRYEWNVQGMLEKVKRPNSREVLFRYDALGRRIAKQFGMVVTRWVWDGNVPLHEQKSQYWRDYEEDKGEFLQEEKQPLVTWIFEEGTFVPAAKLTEQQKFSIATNYMGTPEAMYRENGESVWKCELNSYGKVRKFQGEYKTECPFRFQGQYEDAETGLYYNRFRYYSPEEGMYISQDPIRLRGGISLYSYVHNPNGWVDILGLTGTCDDNDEVIIDDKIRDQMGERGWTEAEIQALAQTDPTGTSTDTRRPNKTPDGFGRNDSASVYGDSSGYMVVNDRTREVTQISDKNDPDWIVDSRISWNE